MFVKHTGDGRMVVLIAYMDDIILIGYDDEDIYRLKKHLALKFEIKELLPLHYFLCMEIEVQI